MPADVKLAQSAELKTLLEKGCLLVGKGNPAISFKEEVSRCLYKYLEADHVYNPVSKEYLKHLNPESISLEDRKLIYRFLTQDFFRDMASQYLGEIPLLVEIKVLISPAIESTDYSGSQMWHSDFDDDSNLKIFHFLKDVDMETGPLQALDKASSQRIFRERGYVWGADVSHDDGLVDEQDSRIEVFTGEAGDTVLIDTANCLHRGSRSNSKVRYILYATYNTRSSFRFPPYHKLLPVRYGSLNEYTVPLIHFDPDMKILDQLAINT